MIIIPSYQCNNTIIIPFDFCSVYIPTVLNCNIYIILFQSNRTSFDRRLDDEFWMATTTSTVIHEKLEYRHTTVYI